MIGRYVVEWQAKLDGRESRWNSTLCSVIFVTDSLLIEHTSTICVKIDFSQFSFITYIATKYNHIKIYLIFEINKLLE